MDTISFGRDIKETSKLVYFGQLQVDDTVHQKT